MGGQKPPKRSSAEEVEPDWLDFSAEYELGVGMMGLSHNEFWDLTPAEFYLMVDGFIKKQKRKTNELLYLAWHTAALGRIKEFPSLQSLLNPEEKHEMTDEEMMAMARTLNAAFGGVEI